MQIADIVVSEIGLGRTAVLSVLLANEATEYGLSEGSIKELYRRNMSLETENFRKLLISFAEDVRVILIMLADRLYTMRQLENYEEEQRQSIARETSFLYAPMAHRLGLYGVNIPTGRYTKI